MSMGWDYVFELWTPTGLLFILMIWVRSPGGKMLTGKSKELSEKLGPAPLCPPQIPHGLTGREPGARGERPAITVWTMARPEL
jgi:hypothetical protein